MANDSPLLCLFHIFIIIRNTCSAPYPDLQRQMRYYCWRHRWGTTADGTDVVLLLTPYMRYYCWRHRWGTTADATYQVLLLTPQMLRYYCWRHRWGTTADATDEVLLLTPQGCRTGNVFPLKFNVILYAKTDIHNKILILLVAVPKRSMLKHWNNYHLTIQSVQ